MVEPGAAPADVPRKRISGRPRVAVRPNYVGPPLVGLDGYGRGLAKAGSRPVAGSTAPGTERPRWSAERRDGPIARPMPRLEAVRFTQTA
jgi:hypothetical protein